IDPGQLEATDFQSYQKWFKTSAPAETKTFTIVNPDGQKADRTFTVPPSEAQSSVKSGSPAIATPAQGAGK
ncbi:MAG TPA: hypothetical protein VNH18_09215, partial [Bryobacteraceae bacterium]|nr:hypothetical protein [Bryobacteraceae bacterium]